MLLQRLHSSKTLSAGSGLTGVPGAPAVPLAPGAPGMPRPGAPASPGGPGMGPAHDADETIPLSGNRQVSLHEQGSVSICTV